MVYRKTVARAGAVLILGGLVAVGTLRAADHRDSPLATNTYPELDITDIYAFKSPQNADNLVVVLNVHPYTGSTPSPLFDEDGRYEIYVSNEQPTPDLEANATVRVTFSGSPQQFTIEGLTSTPITGGLSTTVTSGAVKAFVGPRDDPFFFDLDAFKHFVAGPYIPTAGYRDAGLGAPRNFFAGANVASIIIEAPITAFGVTPTSGKIKAWAKTFRKDVQGS